MSEAPPEPFAAAFFDIGGVIVSLPSIRQGYVDYLTEFAREHDLEPGPAIEQWRETLGKHFRAAEGTEYRTAREGYRKAFAALVDCDLAEEEWRPGFEAATSAAMEPEPNVVDAIETLADRGLYLGIVSDIDTAEAHRMLEQFGIDDAFDGVTTSEAVGRKKPDPAMFEHALEQAPVDPDEAVVIGDRYDHDMEGGKAAGLWTVAYNGSAAEAVADAERDGYRVLDDPAVDFLLSDHADLPALIGLEA
ncbi:MAG: HAD family hydrolase [Haloarculaceae archaeon]